MSENPSPTSHRLWWFPSVAALTFALVFLGVLLYGPETMNADGDVGRHITIGRAILRARSIPTADIFSHTMAGEPLIPHEWLSQILFALAHRAFGLDGVVGLTALVLAASYALLVGGLRRLGVRAPVALLAGLAAALTGSLHWLTRPHIFTFPFFVVFVLALERYRREGRLRALVPLPPLMVLWANLHGAFITGITLVGLYAVGLLLAAQKKRAVTLAALVALLVLVSWINPVGPRLMTHSFEYLGKRFLVDMTQEYRSPDFHNTSLWAFAGMLLGSLALGWRSRRSLDWCALWLLGIWSAFGLYAARNVPLYAIVAAALLAPEAEAWLRDVVPGLTPHLVQMHRIDRRAWGWMWAALLVTLVGLGVVPGFARDIGGFDAALFPVEAVDAMAGQPPAGRVFNEFAWGGYLLYRLWPDLLVFIDGQTDFYGEALSRDYVQIIDAGPRWAELLDHYGVDWVIIPPHRPLAAVLDLSPRWTRTHTDASAAIWTRQ